MTKAIPELTVRIQYEPGRLSGNAEIEAYQLLYPEKTHRVSPAFNDITPSTISRKSKGGKS